MKRKNVIVWFTLLSIIVYISFIHSVNLKFYYAYNEKIYLNELDNKLIVRYKKNNKSDRAQKSLNQKLANYPIKWEDDSTCIITHPVGEKELLKAKILKQADVKTCNPVYAINTGLEMGVTDEFLVMFNENTSQSEMDRLQKQYGTKVVRTTEIYQLLKVPDGVDALQIANMYQESGLTRFSHPNFYTKVTLNQMIPNDPYFVNQFYLNNTGQVFTDGHSGTFDADIDAPEAWTITTGNSNIIVAVLDEGITPGHPDLPNTRQIRLNGSNFCNGDPNDPSPIGNGNHGNACAGIIGATQNNSEGISGIAPNCKIMPIRMRENDSITISVSKLADAINFAKNNGAHIISNSWSLFSDDPNFQPVIKNAIIAATTSGRNGLGCVVVFSAGNNFSNSGPLSFPSNVDVAGVLTVGASDRYDFKAYYSPLGDPSSLKNQLIDLVAPSNRAYSYQVAGETSESWSIDISGNAGYNPVVNTDGGNLPTIGSILPNSGVNYLAYTGRFGGTSAAAPQVAGVAALILSVNPNLTQQQVFDILTTNADNVGGYTYTNGRSNELGFGRLNARRAVTQAITSLSGPTSICPSGSTFTVNNLPTGDNVSWTCSTNITFDNQTGNPKVFTANGTSAGWIQPIIISNCGQIVLPRKDVWNVPPTTYITFTVYDSNGVLAPQVGGTWLMCPNTNYHIYINNSSPVQLSNYTWTTPSGWTQNYTYQNMVSINTNSSPGGQVQVSAFVNDCNNNYNIVTTYFGTYTSCSGYRMIFMPNPAVDQTTIVLTNSEKTFDVNVQWDMEVYDQMQNLKEKKIKLKGSQMQLNTSNLKDGVYIVRVKIEDEVVSEKLVVKH